MSMDVNSPPADSLSEVTGSAPTIAVSGSGSVDVEPTVALLSVGVSDRNPSLQQARQAVTTRLATVRRQLEAVGVVDRDVQTSGLSVHPIHEPLHDQGGGLPGGRAGRRFHVSNTMTVVFRDGPGQAETAIDGLFNTVGDGLELHGLHFDCDDTSEAETEARRLAFEQARVKAEHLARLAGVELGPVVSIVEGREPVPLAGGMLAMTRAAETMAVEGGTLSVSVVLSVRWAIA